MSTLPEYGPALDSERTAIISILQWAFGGSVADTKSWVERTGLDKLRVLREDGRPTGALEILWMGQWFGGRSVPMAGIAAVGVSPEVRGKGAATRLLRGMMEEIRSEGAAISTLYPATQPLYRKAGYEQAGGRFEIRLSPKAIAYRERDLEMRPILDADRDAVIALYGEHARSRNGTLDRNGYIWSRVVAPRGESARGFLVGEEGRPEGYVYLLTKKKDAGTYDLTITDLVALTPRAGRRLLSFLADHRSLAEEATYYGGPFDPLLVLLHEQQYHIRSHYYWMIRVVDVAKALTVRGYPLGVTGTLELSVRDEMVADNNGDFVLEVSGGEARVKRGGRGSFRLDVRSLAPLYSGYMSATTLRSLGWVEAPDRELAVADSLFAGAFPWMPDMF